MAKLCNRIKIAEGDKMAPVYTIGAATFLVVLGLGLSPLPQDSATLFVSRVATVIVASLYTIGVASVLHSLLTEVRGRRKMRGEGG